ncbi:MAG: endonuclease/exonuclease/phosphatase family protein [Ginsengibacter sp.]
MLLKVLGYAKLVIGVSLAFFTTSINAQKMIIGTYNLRYDNANDSGNLWTKRAHVIADLIRFHDFDIFGTQEGLINQLNDVSGPLPQYARYGRGRDDGKDKGEHSAIFYKKEKFTLLDKGDFWLSQTPDTPSFGWDAVCCKRICSWVCLNERVSGKKLYFFNAHFDHQGVVARKESSKLILEKIQSIAGDWPAIFTGDINGSHESEWYQYLSSSGFLFDTYTLVEYPYANNSSFNAFGAALTGNEIIDHIFVTKHFAAVKWGILTDTYHGKFPSDHFPILAEVLIK